MKVKESTGRKIFRIVNVLALLVISFICLAPIWYTVMASFSDPVALTNDKGALFWPAGKPTLEGYKLVLANSSIWIGYANTLFYVVVETVVGILSTIFAAYIFSRKYFKLRNICMLIISFTMLFNGGMVPTYILISKLGLINNRLVIIIPGAINVFNLIVLRTSFMEIPDSLEESAKLDGAGDFRVLFNIILPLSKATISVIVLFIAVAQWNAWFQPAIYLNKRELYPLQLILREILIAGNANLTNASANVASNFSVYTLLIQYCTIVVSTLPILCIYPFIQKYFAKGVMIGSIKG